MKKEKILTRKDYSRVMQEIETILQKATEMGGFINLSADDRSKLSQLSILAEEFEDGLPMMPMNPPKSVADMLRFKMYENGWRQKQLASQLEISEASISGLLSGKRKLSIELAKKMYLKLGIDAQFLLMSV